MNIDMFLKLVENNTCRITYLHDLLQNLFSSENEYGQGAEVEVIELMEKVGNITTWIGNADEIHNLSITFATRGLMDIACLVIKKGLQMYPKAIDLLADFLEYSSNHNSEDDLAQSCYMTLIEISKNRWNWRAYDFSINYLLANIDKGVGDDNENMLAAETLAEEYITVFNNDERAYAAKGKIIKKLKDDGSDIEIYKKALNGNMRAPRCLLRIADYYFGIKNFEESLQFLEKCKIDGLTVENSINMGYVYILSALCKLSILYSNTTIFINIDDEMKNQISDIFFEYRSAAIIDGWSSQNVRGLRKQLDVLSEKTGIPLDY